MNKMSAYNGLVHHSKNYYLHSMMRLFCSTLFYSGVNDILKAYNLLQVERHQYKLQQHK